MTAQSVVSQKDTSQLFSDLEAVIASTSDETGRVGLSVDGNHIFAYTSGHQLTELPNIAVCLSVKAELRSKLLKEGYAPSSLVAGITVKVKEMQQLLGSSATFLITYPVLSPRELQQLPFHREGFSRPFVKLTAKVRDYTSGVVGHADLVVPISCGDLSLELSGIAEGIAAASPDDAFAVALSAYVNVLCPRLREMETFRPKRFY